MFDHILAKFPGEDAVTFKVLGDSPTTQPKPTIQGHQAVIPYNTPVTLPRPFFDVVEGAGFAIELVGTEAAPEQDEPAAEQEDPEIEETNGESGSPHPSEVAPDETLGGGSAASAGGSEEGTGSPSTDLAPTFDADAVIDGNVETVTGRLSSLTDAELTAVQAAEVDREKPRSGVTKAIEAEVAARAAPKGEGA